MRGLKLGGVALIVAFLASAGFVTAAVVPDFISREPGQRLFWFPQDASDSESGIEIRADAANFSASESVLRLIITGEATEHPIGIYRDDVSVPYLMEGEVLAAQGDDNSVLLVMPGVARPGDFVMTIQRLHVGRGEEQRTIDGPWALELSGPDEEALAREFLEVLEKRFDAPGIEVTAAYRSTTQTVITYIVDNGFKELSPPRLLIGGDVVLPERLDAPIDGSRTARFPSTDFGTELVLAWGPFAEDGESAEDAIHLNLAEAAARAGVEVFSDTGSPLRTTSGEAVETKPFTLEASDKTGGNASRVQSARFGVTRGSHTSRWLELLFDGNYGSRQEHQPTAVSANGIRLTPIQSVSSYQKSEDGSIRHGVTFVAYEYSDAMDLRSVTVDLGRPETMIEGQWEVELGPMP